MNAVWKLIEAIDDPSGLIHREKHDAFASGRHPLGKHPAYPEQHGAQPGDRSTNYEEVLASQQWKKILDKTNRYLGTPLTAQALPVIHRKLMGALRLIQQAESNHREQLEALAVSLVFELPEFKSAKKAYEAGRLDIQATLQDEIDLGDAMTSDEAEQPQAQDPAQPPPRQRSPGQQEWIGKMVQRRHFTNAMIQGSSVSNNFLFELGGRALDAIDPGLRNAYGTLMVSTELGYWMFPQDQIIAGAKAQTQVGASQVKLVDPNEEEDETDVPRPPRQGGKIPTVIASGKSLPVLIQEIIKGLTEAASLASLPRSAEDRQEVLRQTDLVDLESWSMMLGPKLWDNFVAAIDAANERELTMHLYSYIQRMDVDEFNAFMKEVLAKSPQGMKMLRDLAAQVKADIAEEESGDQGVIGEAKEIVRQLLDDDSK